MPPPSLAAILPRVRPGVNIVIRHDGDVEWRERIVTGIVHGQPHMVSAVTPDEDHYVHNLRDDLTGIELVGQRGGLPKTVRRPLI